jgi:iron complex outermembrane receptor protein
MYFAFWRYAACIYAVYSLIPTCLPAQTAATVRLRAVSVRALRNASEQNAPTRIITSVEGVELERSRGQTLGETLQNVAGVTLLQTGASLAKPVIRGLHSQRVIVVNAGIQQEGQQWGAEHAPEIDPFAPARIEILRGAAGLEYGAGALGGVIRVVPKPLRTGLTDGDAFGNSFGGSARLGGFSNNLQGALALEAEGSGVGLRDTSASWLNNIAKSFASGFGWRVQGSARKAGDSRAPNYVIGNTGFQELNASIAAAYKDERGGIEAYYSLFSTELGIFRGAHIGNVNDLRRAIAAGKPLTDDVWSYSIQNPRQEIAHDLWSVKAHYITSLGNIEAQYGWQQNNRAEFDAHNARIRGDSGQILTQSLARPAMTLQLTTTSLDVKFKHKAQALKLPSSILLEKNSLEKNSPENISPAILTGTLGASGTTQTNLQGGRTFLIPSYRALSASIYAVETLAMENFIATAGLRYDARGVNVQKSELRGIPDTSQVFTGFSGSIGGLWTLEEKYESGSMKYESSVLKNQTTFAVNIGSAWRAPLPNEQFSNGVHHGTAQYEIGNSALKPEQAYSADITLQHRTNTLRAELSVFANIIDNFIYLRPDAENPTVTVRGTFPTFFYTQTLVALRGFDGSIDAVLGDFENAALHLGGTFSLVRGDRIRNNLSVIEPLIFMPADRARIYARWEQQDLFGLKNVFLEAASTLVRRQDRTPDNIDYAPAPDGYVLFDASLGASIDVLSSHIDISLSVRNIANTSYRDYLSRYRYFTDDAGRNLVVRVMIPFGDVAH